MSVFYSFICKRSRTRVEKKRSEIYEAAASSSRSGQLNQEKSGYFSLAELVKNYEQICAVKIAKRKKNFSVPEKTVWNHSFSLANQNKKHRNLSNVCKCFVICFFKNQFRAFFHSLSSFIFFRLKYIKAYQNKLKLFLDFFLEHHTRSTFSSSILLLDQSFLEWFRANLHISIFFFNDFHN